MIINKTTQFLFPCLGVMTTMLDDNFINCYIADKDNSKYDYPILIVARKEKDDNLLKNKHFIETYEKAGNYLYVFKLPEENIKDYHNFIAGKYSKLSSHLLADIEEHYGIGSQPYRVCTKNILRKKWLEEYIDQKLDADSELMSIIEKEEEII